MLVDRQTDRQRQRGREEGGKTGSIFTKMSVFHSQSSWIMHAVTEREGVKEERVKRTKNVKMVGCSVASLSQQLDCEQQTLSIPRQSSVCVPW